MSRDIVITHRLINYFTEQQRSDIFLEFIQYLVDLQNIGKLGRGGMNGTISCKY
jgi:hypothetical protein